MLIYHFEVLPQQSHKWIILRYTLHAKQTKGRQFQPIRRSHVTRDCFCHVFFRDVTTDFRRNGHSKNRLICDCAGEATHAITTLLSNSLLKILKIDDGALLSRKKVVSGCPNEARSTSESSIIVTILNYAVLHSCLKKPYIFQ